jgi:hypothetical protein
MTILINLLFVLFVSLAIGAMFAIGLRGRNEWAGTFWFFVILFLGTWALGSWLRPIGPPAWDVYWVPYVLAAAVIALLVAAVTPPRSAGESSEISRTGELPPTPREQRETQRNAAAAVATLSVFFWLLVSVSVLAIVLNFVWYGTV